MVHNEHKQMKEKKTKRKKWAKKREWIGMENMNSSATDVDVNERTVNADRTEDKAKINVNRNDDETSIAFNSITTTIATIQ